MKLFLAGIAALSLFGCAEEPTSTSGDNEVNVVDTKAAPKVREDTLWKLHLYQNMQFRFQDLRYPQSADTFSESLVPSDFAGKVCLDCEILAVHQRDGIEDVVELWTYDGDMICSIRQTKLGIVSNTCPDRLFR